MIDELLAEQGLHQVSVLMELDGAESTKRAVEQGLGIGVALRSGVEWELEQGLLKEVASTGRPPLVELGLVLNGRRRLSPMVQAFIEYLRDQLRSQLCSAQEKASEERRVGPKQLARPAKLEPALSASHGQHKR